MQITKHTQGNKNLNSHHQDVKYVQNPSWETIKFPSYKERSDKDILQLEKDIRTMIALKHTTRKKTLKRASQPLGIEKIKF